mmetsp:Transcript_29168/g.43140  ORF Transcript_29168/g.43140 Transcript_29168/m.43140 type:complete len:254 (-) Transcript_29168:205-966(-)
MYTTYWASIDQHTSVTKDPWKFDRPDNRKRHSTLAREHVHHHSQWPNTTSDFTWTYKNLHTGQDPWIQPPRKLAESQSSSRLPTAALSTGRLSSRQQVTPGRLTHFAGGSGQGEQHHGALSSSHQKAPSLHQTTGYMVANQADSKPGLSRGRHTSSAPLLTPLAQTHKMDYPQTKSKYATTQIGLNTQKAARVVEIQNNNYKKYCEAARETSERGDLVATSTTHHFRHKYPHTLGRLKGFAAQKTDGELAQRR